MMYILEYLWKFSLYNVTGLCYMSSTKKHVNGKILLVFKKI